MNLTRVLRHLLLPGWQVRRVFAGNDLAAIGAAIAASENSHRGELRFVVEGPLSLAQLWRGISARMRAVELFSQLGVWDTEENSGILIYVQLVDRRVEILADRGIAARVAQTEWDAICREMELDFRAGDWRNGALRALTRAGDLLGQHFPASHNNPNELPDTPLVL
ncbi:MAG: TPM domain-containing protein [Sulfuritalea sp.]|nr:TPM domain-containing protein [Sulfuritalea sp.]